MDAIVWRCFCCLRSIYATASTVIIPVRCRHRLMDNPRLWPTVLRAEKQQMRTCAFAVSCRILNYALPVDGVSSVRKNFNEKRSFSWTVHVSIVQSSPCIQSDSIDVTIKYQQIYSTVRFTYRKFSHHAQTYTHVLLVLLPRRDDTRKKLREIFSL